MYRPRGQDPFPKPPEYADNYTQLHGDIKGLTQQQLDQAHRGPSGNGPGNGSSTDPHSTNPLAPSPGQGLPAPPPSAYEGKTATKIGVSDVDATGFRGEAVRVRGTITGADGKPVGGVAVNVYLAPAGSSGDGARLVGQTVTAPDGSFQAQVDLPGDLELGRHEVYVSTPGDAKHQPALSE
jgi:protocatechuate 3,4-dioxygenase beta subunit